MKHIRCRVALTLTVAALVALWRWPRLGGWVWRCVCVPAMGWLHRATARVAFPVAEAVAGALLALLGAALVRAAAGGGVRALRRWWRAALAIVLALALLWGPGWIAPVGASTRAESGSLAELCAALIDRLNGSCGPFPRTGEALDRAPVVAGLPGRVVKAARFPGWMALAGAWGMFVPLTGEALVDPGMPAPLLPFTAVHELMHLTGIADEGAANLAAWERCLSAGGPFADSARLWALRYAMGQLLQQDEDAWLAARRRMGDGLLETFIRCGGEARAASPRFSLTTGDYGALAVALAGQ